MLDELERNKQEYIQRIEELEMKLKDLQAKKLVFEDRNVIRRHYRVSISNQFE